MGNAEPGAAGGLESGTGTLGCRDAYLSAVVFSAALQLDERAGRPVHYCQTQVHVLHRLLLGQGPFLEHKTGLGQRRAPRRLGSERGEAGPPEGNRETAPAQSHQMTVPTTGGGARGPP